MANQTTEPSPRKQAAARKAAGAAYPFRCCVICGLQIEASLTVAHLDHHAGNNDPGNLAYKCGTHHWMYDCGLYQIAAIKMLRTHWQETKGVPDHKPRMKDAGAKAARKRDYRREGKESRGKTRRSEGSCSPLKPSEGRLSKRSSRHWSECRSAASPDHKADKGTAARLRIVGA